MTIKKKIYLITFLVVMQTAVVCTILFWAQGQVRHSLSMTESANSIMNGVSELNMLVNEFLLMRNERPLMQWEKRMDSLKEDIRDSENLLGDEASLLKDITHNLERVEEAKNKFLEYGLKGRTARNEELVERTVLFFLLASQNMASAANSLVERTGARIDSLVGQTIAVSSAFLVLFGAGIIAMVSAVAGSIDRPIRDLVEAARRIGGGRLDQETGIDSNDEIGLFAKAFDSMIRRLRAITVSRDELAAEVAERRRAEEELSRSETRYRTIFEHGTDGISIYEVGFDPYGRRLVDCNEAYARAAGMTREELLKVPDVSKLQINEYSPGEVEELRERVRTGKPYRGTFSWRRPDGLENYIEFTSVPVEMDGKMLVFGIDRDVTARVQAQESLMRSQNLLRTVMENVPVIIWAFDKNGIITLIEGEGLADLEAESGDYVGESFYEMYADSPEMLECSKRGLSGEKFHSTIEVRGKYFRVGLNPIFDEGGAVAGVIGSAVNVTRDIEAERALRESEERFRQLAQHVKECFYLKDVVRDRMIYVNPVFEDIWGRPVREVMNDAGVMFEHVLPGDADFARELEKREKQGRQAQGEFRIQAPGKGVRWIWYRSFPILDNNGRVYRVAGAAEDVTWRKSVEDKLRKLSLKVLSAQEVERKRIGRELHDGAGQTLSAIKILLERETARIRTEHPGIDVGPLMKIAPYISEVIVEVRRILMDLRPSMLDDLGLVAAMNWFCREFEVQYPQIKVRTDIAVDEDAVDDTEKTVLFRVMQEAMHNAAKHSGADWVEVVLGRRNGRLELTVCDNGVGFDVAEENFRGVGLAGMRERMELVSGDFAIDSRPGEGAKVRASIKVNGR